MIYLVVVDKVDPWDDVDEEFGVTRVTGSHALEVGGHLGLAVQRLALLDLIDHLASVALNLSGVLGETVETFCECVRTICVEAGIQGPSYGRNAGREREDRREDQRQWRGA